MWGNLHLDLAWLVASGLGQHPLFKVVYGGGGNQRTSAKYSEAWDTTEIPGTDAFRSKEAILVGMGLEGNHCGLVVMVGSSFVLMLHHQCIPDDLINA